MNPQLDLSVNRYVIAQSELRWPWIGDLPESRDHAGEESLQASKAKSFRTDWLLRI